MDYESLAKSIIRDLSIEDGAKLLSDTFAELERELADERADFAQAAGKLDAALAKNAKLREALRVIAKGSCCTRSRSINHEQSAYAKWALGL